MVAGLEFVFRLNLPALTQNEEERVLRMGSRAWGKSQCLEGTKMVHRKKSSDNRASLCQSPNPLKCRQAISARLSTVS